MYFLCPSCILRALVSAAAVFASLALALDSIYPRGGWSRRYIGMWNRKLQYIWNIFFHVWKDNFFSFGYIIEFIDRLCPRVQASTPHPSPSTLSMTLFSANFHFFLVVSSDYVRKLSTVTLLSMASNFIITYFLCVCCIPR